MVFIYLFFYMSNVGALKRSEPIDFRAYRDVKDKKQQPKRRCSMDVFLEKLHGHLEGDFDEYNQERE